MPETINLQAFLYFSELYILNDVMLPALKKKCNIYFYMLQKTLKNIFIILSRKGTIKLQITFLPQGL